MKEISEDWKERWIDRMGLIVCLDGKSRFDAINQFKRDMGFFLSNSQITELKESIRMRFSPTNAQCGCQSAMASVKEVSV